MKKRVVVIRLLTIAIIIIALYVPFMAIKDFSNAMDHNYPEYKVSLNINDSKQKKVFIAEYKISGITLFDTSIKFPVKQVWLEKQWAINLDKSKHEINEIDEKSPPGLVFLLNEDTFFAENNFLKKWIMEDSSKTATVGFEGRNYTMEIIKGIPDSLIIDIDKQKNASDLKNDLIKFARFKIKREKDY